MMNDSNKDRPEPEELTPNFLAQKRRHKRVFVSRFLVDLKNIVMGLRAKLFGRRIRQKTMFQMPEVVQDPFKKFLRQAIVIGVALLVVTSFAPNHILETGFTADFFETDADTDFVEEGGELELPPFLINEEGFMLKNEPSTEESSRIGFTDSLKHTVTAGQSLSQIAALYSISVKTLVWENNISENATLKIGQTLTIPAMDGVSHTVTVNTETLTAIAKKYSVDINLIKEHNKLTDDTIQKGQKLFIPGGKKKDPVIAVRGGGVRGGNRAPINTYDAKLVMSSSSSPQDGKSFIFPTAGRITQGYRGGHYAYDIGNATKPDVWAAAAGTIVKVTGGCPPREVRVERGCGHGYGNSVVIDHGDGLQTLYAHLETVYVAEGQTVFRGQSLGKMGNTGRAYGQTGIHLHFEVYDNGVKKNPANYW